MSNIGMMEGAFFVGRKEIMDWINGTLDLNLAKVEDTANGAVACQLLDIMYPNQVPMHKLSWAAKQDFEFVANYKVLQSCFTKLSIDRNIDVDRLISGRYMDNLEFMQWFKKFFEMSVSGRPADYDCYAQRCKGKGGATFNNGGKRQAVAKPAAAPSVKPSSAPAKTVVASKSKVAEVRAPASATASNQENAAPNSTRNLAPSADKDKEIAALRSALDESKRSLGELKVEMEGIDKEREFYFDKLRDIEVMLQEVEEKGLGSDLTAAIFKILYASADGFEPAAEEPIAAISVAAEASSALEVLEGAEETY